jgi:regulation of enolase protein 1 (concanavalin A-like superfamily)
MRGPCDAGLSTKRPSLKTALSAVLAGAAGAVAAANGPVLPAQTDLTIAELTAIRVTNTATDLNISTNNSGVVGAVTNTIGFSYANRSALLADGWSFLATNPDGTPRNTEITNASIGAVVSYDQTAHPGTLQIPCDVGDLWGGLNSSRNSLFRSVPTNWVSLQLAVSFATSINFQQMHLSLYQDDDNFIQAGLAHNDGLGGEVTTLVWEVGATPNHFATGLNSVTNIYLRLDHNLGNSNITGLYSLNGTTWSVLGTASPPLVNPRLCIWVGGSPVPWTNGLPRCSLRQLAMILTNSAAPALTYQLVNAPAGASIDSNGIITWTPAEAQGPGTNVITTVVTDNQLPPMSATNSFAVVVNEVNAPPVLPFQPDRTLIGQQTLSVTNTAADTDLPANALTYLLSGPVGAAIDTNGVITWTPTPAQIPSTNLFATVVTDFNTLTVDAQQLSATNSFMVVALPAGPILPPQTDLIITQRVTLVVTNTATENFAPSSAATNTVLFGYPDRNAVLADGWSFLARNPGGTPRNTEITNPAIGAVVSYDQSLHAGALRIPCDFGDLWASLNSSRNSLFRALATNWTSLRLALVFDPAANYQQAHLALYQDDDNYVQAGVAYNNGEKAAMDQESGGNASTLGTSGLTASNVLLRLDRDVGTGDITALYSVDGASWTTLSQASQALVNPRLAIWVGGSAGAYTSGSPYCDLQRLEVLLTNPVVPPVLTYQLVNPPAGANISASGIITLAPAQSGDYVITTVVTDNANPPLSATNIFTVSVSNTPAIRAVISYHQPGNTAQLQFDGTPGSAYQILWAPTVLGPWSPLATVVADGNGHVLYLGPAPASTAFFRVLVPPEDIILQAPLGAVTGLFVITNGYIYQPVGTDQPNGGRAAYTFTVGTAGTYVIKALVNAPDTGANSFFVNIDAEPQAPGMIWDISALTSGFEWRAVSWRGTGTSTSNQFAPVIFSLQPGDHQVIIRGREANAQLQSLTIVPVAYLAVTSSVVQAPFVLTSGHIYQSSQTGLNDGGRAVFNFAITKPGNYVVQAAVNAPDAGANSFFSNIDGEPQDPGMIWDIPVTSGFEQRLVSWRGNGTDTANQFVPKVFALSAGLHQLVVRGREANAVLGDLVVLPYP